MWWNIALWLNWSPAALFSTKSLSHDWCTQWNAAAPFTSYAGVCVVSSERLWGAAVEGRDGSGAASEQTASLLPTVMITHATYSAQISTLLRHDSIQALNTTPCYIIVKKWWMLGWKFLGTRGHSYVTVTELIGFWKGTEFVEVHTIPETDLLFPLHISRVPCQKRVKVNWFQLLHCPQRSWLFKQIPRIPLQHEQ